MHRMKAKNSLSASAQGQALVEYVLIFVLVIVAFAVALAATGPAISNVFSNTVYNLLGQTTTPRALGNANDFWMTVTWVATQTPQEFPLPTRTQPPPPPTVTPGPSPTPTPTVPTNTPTNTFTPGPTATPMDLVHPYPFTDTADEPVRWRIDRSFFLGSDDWFGEYFPNKTLSGSPSHTGYNGAPPNEAMRYQINYNWGNGSPISGWLTNDFSIRWKRKIYLPQQTKLTFYANSDDGMRIWLLKPGQTAGSCSSVPGAVSGGGTVGSSPSLYGDTSAFPNDCLILAKWYNSGALNLTVERTVAAGEYTLQVDYFENTGSASAIVNVAGLPANVDDALLSGTGPVDCNWGRHPDSRNANTAQWMWEEHVGGDIPNNMRCHLELRGSVNIPVTAVNPEFTFWDIWDFRNANQTVYLEFAQYVPLNDPARSAPGYWNRVNLHTGGAAGPNTANYNWTRQVINLTNVNGVSYVGKQLTWRFVIENRSTSTPRRWYIDDIRIDDRAYKDYRIGMKWNLDDNSQKADFITTGRWDLTSTNKRGGTGMSWDDSPGGSTNPGSGAVYEKHNESDAQNIRVHSVEFNGWIDLADAAGLQDLEGDTGIPLLSFWHAYSLGSNVYAEVQYTTSPYGLNVTDWKVVPSADPLAPYGAVLPASGAGSARFNPNLSLVEIPLDQIPATRFRLRFALMVRSAGNLADGWWIDDIYLERKGVPKYTNYPFFDNAEAGAGNWLMGGSWDRALVSVFPDGDHRHSFTDSPNGNYIINTNAAMTLANPIDFNNDTPTNPKSSTCNLGPGKCTFDGVAAVKPYMSFYHRRAINSTTDGLFVEWKRVGEADTPANWKPLWAYVHQMATLNSAPGTRTRTQLDWEYVFIDLSTITYNPNDSVRDDDDILFRFRLFSDGSNTADGVYIDDVRIEEYVETSFKLWPTNDSSGGFGFGNGTTFFDDIDTPFEWWLRWINGGGWTVVDWERKSGLKSFHDSAIDETANPIVVQTSTLPDPTGPVVVQRHQTFNVLEMRTIIDLRAVTAASGPTLYYWTRYFTGDNDRFRVQVSVEDPTNLFPCTSQPTFPNCYEHVRGWSEWATLRTIEPFRRTYTWIREQVSLDSYVGKRIKIRFVSDALENNNNRDGVFIDDITIKYRNPPRLHTLPFTDSARNMSRWIPEGKWGLDPEFFRGSGGGPASLGAAWNGYWWDCATCESLAPPGTSTANRFRVGADLFLKARPNNQSPTGTEVVLDINKDVDFGNLFCATASPTTCYSNRVVARYELVTPPVGVGLQPGDYTFVVISDEGVRMKYDTVPSGGVPGAEWNIINNWVDHGRQVDMGTATLSAPNTYKFTVEYYEKTNAAVIIVTLGSNSFSFTDSPKQGAGPAFPDIPAVPRGNSSLLLDGLLDLTGTTSPVMEFYNYHELDTGSIAWVEISQDGGFTWGAEGAANDSAYRNLLMTGGFSDPKMSNKIWTPKNGDWERRQHNLAAFAGQRVGLRFRLDRTGTDCLSSDGTCTVGASNYNLNGYFISWWIVDIRILQP